MGEGAREGEEWARTAFVGQKVVCVVSRQDWCAPPGLPMPQNIPAEDAIYTIERILSFACEIHFCLAEIVNDPAPGFGVPTWCSHAFRPLVARPTGMDIFDEILRRAEANPPGAIEEAARRFAEREREKANSARLRPAPHPNLLPASGEKGRVELVAGGDVR
jgi:hypothetical protein